MTKREFLELVKKYEQGRCSFEEEKIIFEYCNRAQIKQKLKVTPAFDEGRIRNKLLARIDATIRNEQAETTGWRSKWSYAAAVVVVLMAAVFLAKQFTHSSGLDYTNEITLQLGNGEVIPLGLSEGRQIIESEGVIIGYSQNGKLVYQSADTSSAEHTLTVPYGKTFMVQLTDSTQINLNSGTDIHYPANYISSNNRRVSITGEAFLQVSKDPSKPFIVEANGFNVRVLGTSFNVNTYKENTVDEVVLVEGEVGLYTGPTFSRNGSTILEPGNKASFSRNNQQFSTEPTATTPYTAWVNGELVIRNMVFENLLKTLERRFNVEIENTNNMLNEELISANFGLRPSIQQVMNDLAILYDVKFKTNGNQITIQ